jgi:hypothetical protein
MPSPKYKDKIKQLQKKSESERELPYKVKPISSEGEMKVMEKEPMKKRADMPKELTPLEKQKAITDMIREQGVKKWQEQNLTEEEMKRRLNLWK